MHEDQERKRKQIERLWKALRKEFESRTILELNHDLSRHLYGE